MTPKQFIEKAIEGGFMENPNWSFKNEDQGIVIKRSKDGAITSIISIEQLLLNPLAWQAVGKVEGWKNTSDYMDTPKSKAYWYKMHDIIDALCDGKSIEQFLETL